MNMYAPLDSLPAELRERIDGLQMRHKSAHTLQGEVRLGRDDASDPIHPLVRTHPDTGRKALFLGRQRNGVHRAGTIVDVPPDESDALLDRIWERVREESVAWYHTWRVGDFILWDNRCVMHRRGPFNSKMRRIMHRTQIKDSVAPAWGPRRPSPGG